MFFIHLGRHPCPHVLNMNDYRVVRRLIAQHLYIKVTLAVQALRHSCNTMMRCIIVLHVHPLPHAMHVANFLVTKKHIGVQCIGMAN